MAVGAGDGARTASGRGCFITLEGGECAGKSTQIARIANWLRDRGVAVVTTREPGGSPAAEVLRTLLLEGRARRFGPRAEALLFAIARADHMETRIRPALNAGKWVVCDRFMDSTRVYQGADGVSESDLHRLDEIAVGTDRPDLTLILDLPVADMETRMAGRNTGRDRFEADDRDRHADRRRRFLAIAAAEPDRCAVVDAGRREEDVFADIAAILAARFDLPDTRAGEGGSAGEG